MAWDMTETQKPSSSRRRMSFPMSGWTLMTNSSGQPVETMPLKSPVDFAKLRVSTVQEYLLIYLLCDGTQLADVFESFCNHIKGTHKLNPLFFYGAPSLSYNAMLYKFRGDGNVHPVLLSE